MSLPVWQSEKCRSGSACGRVEKWKIPESVTASVCTSSIVCHELLIRARASNPEREIPAQFCKCSVESGIEFGDACADCVSASKNERPAFIC